MWERIPKMAKVIAIIVAGLAAIGTAITWGQDGYDHLHTQPEADAMQQEIYQFIADEKRYDRVQRNAREYNRLELAYKNEAWTTVGGKDLMFAQIGRLRIAICNDDPKQEICLP